MSADEASPIGVDWEAAFAPYDDEVYEFVVERITPQDVVLDIGAGDLRLARRLAEIAQHVYAVEKNAAVLPPPDRREACGPDKLSVIHDDALTWKYPSDVTVAVLLMRHCTCEHFAQIVQRLTTETQCQRLFTNARWKMNVEEMHLLSARSVPYDPARVGWYACRCGAVGFTPGDPQAITTQLLADVSEVASCPACGV